MTPAEHVPAQLDGESKKRPASQYYWGDWWKDKGLHSCSLAARGLWHEMNCLMHEGEPYGHLTLNGRAMTTAQLANQCRISPAQCAKLLRELEDAGVPSRTDAGVLFSRRMVRDEATRNARAAGGKAGAEHGLKGAEHGAKGGRPPAPRGVSEAPSEGGFKPPPSSSSSSSSSGRDTPAIAGGGVSPPASPPVAPPALTLVNPEPPPKGVPDCPHKALLALWAEVLPALPQHNPELWKGARADHLRTRWRETAASKGWTSEAEGLTYFRRLFAYVGQSAFLTGRTRSTDGRPPFVAELAWLVKPENWAKTIEGKYHAEAA